MESWTYIQEWNIELLSGVSSGKIAPDIDIVVANDPADNIRGRDAFGALSHQEHALLLDRLVHIVGVVAGVGNIVVCNHVDLVCGEKVVGQHPGRVTYDLVDIATVTNTFVALVLTHYRFALVGVR